MAAVIAGILALLTAGILVWYVFLNVGYGRTGGWSSLTVQNVFSGVLGAGSLVVAAGFTFARTISGAWTLCGLCVLYIVAMIVAQPLLGSTDFGTQLKWIFGFEKSNGVAIALAIIFSAPTAIMAAIAASVKSSGPITATPPRP